MIEILPLLFCLQPTLGTTNTRRFAVIITALLTMTGRVTMLGLSRWTEKRGSYATVQRFFYASIPWLTLSWLFFRTYLWQPGDTYILAGDETVVTKSGKETFGLDCVFSSIYQKAVPGVALWVWALVSLREGRAYPLLVEPVLRTTEEKAAAAARTAARRQALQKQKTRSPQPGGKRGRPLGSKTQKGVEAELNAEMQRISQWLKLVLEVLREVLEVRYVVLDGHFGNAGGYALARAEGLEVISKLRSDAALYANYEGEQKGQGRRKRYGAKIDYRQLPASQRVSSAEAGGYLTEKYHLVGVWQKKFGVQLNVLVLVMTRLKDGQQRQAVLFSSDLKLEWEKLEKYYRLRFQIEFNFREAKQHWGLEDFMVTSEEGVKNATSLSLFMVQMSEVLLRRGGMQVSVEKRVNDLKVTYLGWKYARETIKRLGEKAEGIKIEEVCGRVSRLGRIHQEIELPCAA
jgi:putative transposase